MTARHRRALRSLRVQLDAAGSSVAGSASRAVGMLDRSAVLPSVLQQLNRLRISLGNRASHAPASGAAALLDRQAQLRAVLQQLDGLKASLGNRATAAQASTAAGTRDVGAQLRTMLQQLDGLKASLGNRAVAAQASGAIGMRDRRTELEAVLQQLNVLNTTLTNQAATVRAARGLNQGSALLAASVLLDSAMEHYRGDFKNRAMYAPLVVSGLTLAMNAQGTTDPRPSLHMTRGSVAVIAALTGLAGTGIHLWNVMKRPGRLDWQNLFYGAPVGGPLAILLAGLLGAAAEKVRDNPGDQPARLLGVPAGRLLAGVSGLGLLGTSSKAALPHFRGAFHNPAMFIPVTLPPVAAGLLLNSAIAPRVASRPPIDKLARFWLWLTALMGGAGVLVHAMGVWRNRSQNVVDGPSLPAPPSSTGLALAGLAAIGLLREHPDA